MEPLNSQICLMDYLDTQQEWALEWVFLIRTSVLVLIIFHFLLPITIIANFHHSLKLMNLFGFSYFQYNIFPYVLENKQKTKWFSCHPLLSPCFCSRWWYGLLNEWSWCHFLSHLWTLCSIYPTFLPNPSHLLKSHSPFFIQPLLNFFQKERKHICP